MSIDPHLEEDRCEIIRERLASRGWSASEWAHGATDYRAYRATIETKNTVVAGRGSSPSEALMIALVRAEESARAD